MAFFFLIKKYIYSFIGYFYPSSLLKIDGNGYDLIERFSNPHIPIYEL